MRSKNPELIKKISAYVDAFYRANHFSPSLSEIAKGVDSLIKRIDVYRDYKLKIDFNFNLNQFVNGLDSVE